MDNDVDQKDEIVYVHAPIVDAILELRLPPDRHIKLETAKRISSELLREGLEKIADWRSQSAHFSESGVTISDPIVGKELMSDDEKLVVRSLVNSFVFIQRAPYRDWWYFERMAKKFWSVYQATVATAPTRIGLRFINRIPIPVGEDQDNYFTCYPKLDPGLPQRWSNSAMRIELAIPNTKFGVGLVQQWAVRDSEQQSVDATLDIDVFALSSGFSEDEIWSRLTEMRAVKNEFFEKCITDRVREIIK